MNVIWERDPRARWRRSGSRIALASPESEEVVVLDGTGAVAWELLVDPVDQEDLIITLADAFDTAPELVRGDILPFLEELRSHGAVRAR